MGAERKGAEGGGRRGGLVTGEEKIHILAAYQL